MASTIPSSRPATASAPARQPSTTTSPRPASTPKSFTPKQIYLIGYNFLSFVLWYALLVMLAYPFIMLLAFNYIPDGSDPNAPPIVVDAAEKARRAAATKETGVDFSAGNAAAMTVAAVVAQTYPNLDTFLRYVQSLAALEVAHSLLGLVRAPVLTTLMQVGSRYLVVWGVLVSFGERLLAPAGAGMGLETVTSSQMAYVGMLVAWSVTECVRYGYFVFFLAGAKMPEVLGWMRYNGFFVLYPLGISSECWLIYSALPYAKATNMAYYYFLVTALVVYVPGSYILYTHMMAQRRRVIKGKGPAQKPHAE